MTNSTREQPQTRPTGTTSRTAGAGGNNEAQCYVNSTQNVFVQDGSLNIKAIYVPGGYQGSASGCTLDPSLEGYCTATRYVTSGRIRTYKSILGHWTYGRFEINSKMPKGNFLWPAIWMLPTDSVYGSWAASGEIDIQEYRGQQPNVSQHTLHFGNVYPNTSQSGSGEVTNPFDLSEDFHVYVLEWMPSYISFFVDDSLKFTQSLNQSFWNHLGTDPYTKNGQPFDQRFHFLLNLAVAGDFFPSSSYGNFDAATAAPTWTQTFQVDYIRVYTWNNGTSTPSPTGNPTQSPTMSPSSAAGSASSFSIVFSSLLLLVGFWKFF